MLLAFVNGIKTNAIPNQKGKCPLCNEEVFSRCGDKNVWHWAHSNKNCDSWYERESEWHKNWKQPFGKENCEVIMQKGEEKHFADIFINDIVIELQNSPIESDTIIKRESFYGERMFWIINGSKFKNQFYTALSNKNNHYEFYRKNNPLKKDSKSIDDTPLSPFEISNFLYRFEWSHPRKSWEVATRKIFIDFDEEYLFLVKNGMGSKKGFGHKFSKQYFLELYSKIAE